MKASRQQCSWRLPVCGQGNGILAMTATMTAAMASLGLGLLPAWAHGARLEHRTIPQVEVQAQFDSGEPMAAAQVAVFSAQHPQEPWLTGLTDQEGLFQFVPDVSKSNQWEVQVRQGGHGVVTTINLNAADSAPVSGYTPAQMLLMTALGLWGCLGTGLFFAHRSADGGDSESGGEAKSVSDVKSDVDASPDAVLASS